MTSFYKFLIVCAFILILPTSSVFALTPFDNGNIPPTRAFDKIKTDDNSNVTAKNYSATVKFKGHDGISVLADYFNNVINFFFQPANAGINVFIPETVEDLTNVTDSGCVSGQWRIVNATGWYICGTSAGSGEANTASNFGTYGTGFWKDKNGVDLRFYKALSANSKLIISGNSSNVIFNVTSVGGSGNATLLNDLGDVVITSPAYHSILAYDGVQWIDKIFRINNQSVQKDFQIVGINNQTGSITTNQFSVNSITCPGSSKISAIDNATGVVTCSGGTPSSGNATVLSDLGDVAALSSGYGDILQYDGSKYVDKLFMLNNQTVQKDFQIVGINNRTGIITTNQFSVNTIPENNNYFVTGINNVTGTINTKQFTINYPAAYTIYICGTTYCVKNSTNNIVFNGTKAEDAIQYGINQTGNVYVSQGTYVMSPSFSGLKMTSFTSLTLDQKTIIGVLNGYSGSVFRFTNQALHSSIQGGSVTEAGSPQRKWTALAFESLTSYLYDDTVHNVFLANGGTGVLFTGTHGYYINGIRLEDMYIGGFKKPMEFNYTGTFSNGTDGFNRNTFSNVIFECDGTCTQGIKNIEHWGNQFIDVSVFDMNPALQVATIHANASDTLIIGGMMTEPNFVDSGLNTMIFDDTDSKLLHVEKLVSKADNPANGGVIRLGNSEAIFWRNFANTVNIGMEVNAVDSIIISPVRFDFNSGYIDNSGSYTSNSTKPATTGAVRLGNSETIFWRNLANTTNIGLQVDAADSFIISPVKFDINGGNIDNSVYYTSNSTKPALSGAIRLGNAESIFWRNAANTTDLGFQVDGSDELIYSPMIHNINTGAFINGNFASTTNTFGPMEKLSNVTDTGCAVNQIRKVNATGWWVCAADNTGSGISSINGDATAAQVFSGTAGNVTITDTGAGTLQWNLGDNVMITGGSPQTVTGTKNFADNSARIINPAGTFAYDIRSSAILGTRDAILPLADGNFQFIDNDTAQTLSGKTLISLVSSSSGSDPADSGIYRLSNNESICFEANPTGTDACVAVNAANDLVLGAGVGNFDVNSNPLINSLIVDSVNTVVDNGDITKKLAFQASGISTAHTQTWTAQNRNGTVQFMDRLQDHSLVTGDCADGQFLKYQTANSTWICSAGGSGISSINGDATAAQVFSGTAGNVTITDTGAGTLQWNLGTDVVMTGGSAQTVTKGLTANTLKLGGLMDALGNTIDNVGILTSNAANPAGAGAIRLGNAESIFWRNAANNANIGMQVNAGDAIIISPVVFDINGGSIDNSVSYTTNAADPADAGALRFGNAEAITWEASPAGTDVDLQVDGNEDFLFDSDANNINFNSNPLTNVVHGGTVNANNQIIKNIQFLNFSGSDTADSGAIRYNNGNSTCWEASPAGTDTCISADASEDFVFDTNWNNINLNSNPLTNGVLGATLNANNNILDNVAEFHSNADEADAGVIRLGNAETIAWEASPAGTDVDLQVDANEDFLFDSDANNINTNSNPIINGVLTTPQINGLDLALVVKTADYTATATDDIIYMDVFAADRILTLPTASSNTGKIYTIVAIGASTKHVVISAPSDKINGNFANFNMTHMNEVAWVQSNGTTWQKLADNRQVSPNDYAIKGSTTRWYGNYYNNLASNTVTSVVSTLRASPLIIPHTIKIDKIQTETSTAANPTSTTCRVGIYRDNGAGYPQGLVTNSDAGTFITDAAVHTLTFASPITLEKGLYWAAYTCGTAATTQPTWRAVGVGAQSTVLGYVSTMGANGGGSFYTVAFTYAALPVTFPPSATITANTNYAMILVETTG